ncbi:MAG: hypothetical protein CSB49_00910 [Proteobacteria bacterium]|nr:MAG: hypothetical protein CSB49_00910 [Pseudomonadota bacterium]
MFTFILGASALLAVAGGCPWEFAHPRDPYRCRPRCAGSERCVDGVCRRLDLGTADSGGTDVLGPNPSRCPRTASSAAAGRRGYHSADALAPNLYLQDLDNDGLSEWLLYRNTNLFMSRIDDPTRCYFNKDVRWGIGNPDPPETAIKRIIIDNSESNDHKTLCAAIYGRGQGNNGQPGPLGEWLRCYNVLSLNRVPWGGSLTDYTTGTARVAVADLDGDDRDNRVVYEPDKGTFFFDPPVGSWWLALHRPLHRRLLLGNLIPEEQVQRAELILVEASTGRVEVLRCLPSGTSCVLGLAFEMTLPALGPRERVTIANLLGGEGDQLVVHHELTGAHRVYVLDAEGSDLVEAPSLAEALPVRPNTRLHWSRVAFHPEERGGIARNDPVYVDNAAGYAWIYHARLSERRVCGYSLAHHYELPLALLGPCHRGGL